MDSMPWWKPGHWEGEHGFLIDRTDDAWIPGRVSLARNDDLTSKAMKGRQSDVDKKKEVGYNSMELQS